MTEFEPDRFEMFEPIPYRFELERRAFLGAGVLLTFAWPALGQRPAESRIHIGDGGKITILSGKVEEGQGARTELAMAAAEELRLPLGRVHVLMADTDHVPNDGITAGSRTTPSNVPAMRRSAAALRALLVQTASQSWKLDALQVRDGFVSDPGGTRKLGYADIRKHAPVEGTLTVPKDWHVLGTPQVRVNARDLVTGAHLFPSDVVRPGMLYGAVLRAPEIKAKLVSADVSAAPASVTVVKDGDFIGVAAASSFAARRAVQAIAAKAQWSATEHPSSSVLFEYLKSHAMPEKARPVARGNVEEALSSAARRERAVYHVAYVQHAPMEPRAAVAEWSDGKLTVWTGASNPFSVREQLAQAFSIPPARVRVIVPDFGGGFGGKHTGEAAIEAARLARSAGKPVSLRWTRAEEFTWAYHRPAALIEVEAGVDAVGAITAWDFANYNSGASAVDTPYNIAHSRARYVPSESPLRQGSYRALAATANTFARESFTDELARAAGRDPLEYRLAHLTNERIRKVLEAAAERFRWAERRKQARRPGHGMGLACGTEKNSVVATCVEIEVQNGVPKVLEIVEAYECGAILNPAGLRQQVEGAILMGLGPALFEEIQYAAGKMTNARFARYRVPRFRDVPKLDLVLLDRRDMDPIGAGETPIIAVAPAIANAVLDATGKAVRSMPIRLPSAGGRVIG